MLRMTEGFLKAGHEVTTLCIATHKHPWLPEKIDTELLQKTKMDAVFIDTNVKWLPAFLALFKTSSYNIDRFYSLGFEARLIELLSRNEFDIVQLESLYLCPYISAIRRVSRAKIVLRAHNTESDIWKKNAADESDPFKKLWFKDLAGKLERYEKKAIAEVDAIVPITEQDATRLREFGTTVPMHVATFAMPLTIHNENVASVSVGNKTPDSRSVFHIGSMDWKPNYDGVNWLVKEIWPLVLHKIPDAQLHLAGRAMNRNDFSGLKNIIAHGEVPDAAQFMATYEVMAIPLFSGGGVKVKMIEGMFAGKPIVTTAIGAEGIAGVSGREFLLAKDANDFAECLVRLLMNPSAAKEIGANAKKTSADYHELGRVTEKLCDFYRMIL